MQTPGRLNDGAPLEYGLGLEITGATRPGLVSHSGSTGGYKTWLARYPDDRGVGRGDVQQRRDQPRRPGRTDLPVQALLADRPRPTADPGRPRP
jgi:hypothetical protein